MRDCPRSKLAQRGAESGTQPTQRFDEGAQNFHRLLHNTKKYRKVKKEYRVASVKQSKTLEAGYPEGSRKQIQ